MRPNRHPIKVIRKRRFSSMREMAEIARLGNYPVTLQTIMEVETPGATGCMDGVSKLDNYLRMLGYTVCIRPLAEDEPIEPIDPFEHLFGEGSEPAEANSGAGQAAALMGEHHSQGPDREAGPGLQGISTVRDRPQQDQLPGTGGGYF